MDNAELNKAAIFFYNMYCKKQYEIKNISEKMIEAVLLLQEEKFMNNEFWLRLNGTTVYIEPFKKESIPRNCKLKKLLKDLKTQFKVSKNK